MQWTQAYCGIGTSMGQIDKIGNSHLVVYRTLAQTLQRNLQVRWTCKFLGTTTYFRIFEIGLKTPDSHSRAKEEQAQESQEGFAAEKCNNMWCLWRF